MSARIHRPIRDCQWIAALHLKLGLLLGLLAVAAPQARAQFETRRSATSHIVHRFDFNEPNYYGDVPRGWLRFPDRSTPDPAFPRYTEGHFDLTVGHDAAPSFYLESHGRSVAYRYDSSDTRIRPGEYVVTGWIKPNNLKHARAALSAYYLDWEGTFLPGTQRFSGLIGSGDAPDAWHALEVELPSAPSSAHFVGLTCWVVQDDVWSTSLEQHRHLPLRDVHAGAWFDDITVKGRPRAVLTSAHPGNIVESPAPLQLAVVVADEETAGLSATLTIVNRDGLELTSRSIPVQNFEDSQVTHLAIEDLAPGIYHAVLVVRSLDEPIIERALTLAVLGRRHRPPGQNARQMGVILSEAPVGGIRDTEALLTQLGVGSVKLPIWPTDPSQPAFDAHPQTLHDLLDRLIASRVSVIGVLGGAPTSMVRNGGAHAATLLDVLSQDPLAWRGEFDSIYAPYASIFDGWQLGSDADETIARDPRVAPAFLALRDAMREMLPSPRLAIVASAGDWPGETQLPARSINLIMPADVHATHLAETVAPYRERKYDHVWLTLASPERYARAPDASLAEWALRLLAARECGVDRVFAPAPWQVRPADEGVLTEPTDAYLVLRTLNDQIGDAEFLAAFDLEPAGTTRTFGDGQHATVVAWDPQAPPEGTPVTLQLGRAEHLVDMWGREVPLQRNADGMHELVLTQSPVFIPGVEQWVIALCAGMRLSPPQVSFAIDPQRHVLHLDNPRDVALSGEIEFLVPAPWEVNPNRVRFALPAQTNQDIPLLIRQPLDETAGTKVVRARVSLSSEPSYPLEIPLRFALGLPDVEVWGYAVNEETSLRIRQGLTNRSSKPLSFSAFAMVPGRSRQYRTVNELLPGQSLTIDYLFTSAADVSGRRVRLGLREVNGPRLHNLEIQVP